MNLAHPEHAPHVDVEAPLKDFITTFKYASLVDIPRTQVCSKPLKTFSPSAVEEDIHPVEILGQGHNFLLGECKSLLLLTGTFLVTSSFLTVRESFSPAASTARVARRSSLCHGYPAPSLSSLPDVSSYDCGSLPSQHQGTTNVGVS